MAIMSDEKDENVETIELHCPENEVGLNEVVFSCELDRIMSSSDTAMDVKEINPALPPISWNANWAW